MAVNKSKVAIGFLVAGTLTVVFGGVLLCVGPAVMKDQIIKILSESCARGQFSVLGARGGTITTDIFNTQRARQTDSRHGNFSGMAINKSKVAVGFIVAGALGVFFGVVLTFVGPLIIDDQIVKNTVIDPNNDMTYTMWKDIPVPFFMSVYFFNVLNPKEV
ncbi:hypothetical protein WMY93_020771 [Mugilogobius chulae]|uniref:Scavenger receptor class B member 1 n=1 Tax=Mugilogobius chulae TaxID=88201 RepID=A0AAW0ND45_9GOBI